MKPAFLKSFSAWLFISKLEGKSSVFIQIWNPLLLPVLIIQSYTPWIPNDIKTSFTKLIEEHPSISMQRYELPPDMTPIPVAEAQK